MAEARRLDLKVGFACNNRCVFCAQGDKRKVCGALPYARLLDQLVQARRTCRGVVFTGGEPTVHKNLLALVRAARDLGYDSVQIQTNGRMLAYKKAVDALVAAGATEFSPSLHGATADVHELLTRADGSFDESVAGIDNAVRSGALVVTNSVITRYNQDTLPDLVALLAGLGVKHAQLAFVHPVGTALERFYEVVPKLSELVEPLARAQAIAVAAGMMLVTEAVPLCFLRGMEELAVESSIPDTTVVDLEGALDYSDWRVREGKTHGPPCAECALAAHCEGPWREYPEHYGWSEFVGVGGA